MIASAGEEYTPDSGESFPAAWYSPVSPSTSVVRKYSPVTMSSRGMASGRPDAGDRMLLEDSIRMRASACASALNGRCTAIWSPSKSALNASQTKRVQLNGLAFHQHWLEGLNTQPVQGGRNGSAAPGAPAMTSSRTSHTCGR